MKHNPSNIILAIILETGGLAIAVAVAGISDAMANLMLLLVVGIGLLWLMNNYTAFNGTLQAISNIERAA